MQKLKEKYIRKDIKDIEPVKFKIEKVKVVKQSEEKLINKAKLERKGDLEEKEKPHKEGKKKRQREKLKLI